MLVAKSTALALGVLASKPSGLDAFTVSSGRVGGSSKSVGGFVRQNCAAYRSSSSSCNSRDSINNHIDAHRAPSAAGQGWDRNRSQLGLPAVRGSSSLRAGNGQGGLRMALAGAARPKADQDPARRHSSHSFHLDDFRFVTSIKGGVHSFLDAIDESSSGELVTIVTYMPWCRSCHHLRHRLRMLAEAHAVAGSDSHFYEIDLHESPEVQKMMDIHAAPTVLLYCGGQLVDEFVCSGVSGPKVMVRHIEDQVGAIPALPQTSNPSGTGSDISTSPEDHA